MIKQTASYWETTCWTNHWDVIILGAGLIGLQAARHLKKLNPDQQVLVLERGYLPTGASTRNAGFACFGSLSELLNHRDQEGAYRMMNLVSNRFRGLQALRATVPDSVMDYEELGGFEIFTPDQEDLYTRCMSELDWFNRELRHETGLTETYQVADDRIAQFGFSGVSHLIWNRAEGQLNSGKLTRYLWQEAARAGVFILGGMNASLLENGSLSAPDGTLFSAKQILVTTNAFTGKILPELDVIPGRGQVLVTDPIPDLPVRGAFHYDDGYFYFRNIENRILLGGGRNLNFTGEETTEFGLTNQIQSALETLLKSVILPTKTVGISHRWSGIMAFGKEKKPLIGEIRPGIWTAVRMSGMGVALGTQAAQTVVEDMLKTG